MFESFIAGLCLIGCIPGVGLFFIADLINRLLPAPQGPKANLGKAIRWSTILGIIGWIVVFGFITAFCLLPWRDVMMCVAGYVIWSIMIFMLGYAFKS